MSYLMKATNNETHLVKLEPLEPLAYAATDFLVRSDSPISLVQKIKNTQNDKQVAEVRLYDKATIEIFKGRKQVSSFDGKDYHEHGKLVSLKEVKRPWLLSNGYEDYQDEGITHGYFLPQSSNLERVICFEKEGELSAIIESKKDEIDAVLIGLTLALYSRIEQQEYVFGFLK